MIPLDWKSSRILECGLHCEVLNSIPMPSEVFKYYLDILDITII